ncbi:hypothetical protein E4U42_003689 [Claviceps africana]|uniref:Altered inheritance of mitochondria protein 11 n=1 Tax=Claviceps africana TaxID=83212 RepID=A0A8K0J8U2_9HYPO|nr:hypothetical protein E4U42_003689 [Claviceps africana]
MACASSPSSTSTSPIIAHMQHPSTPSPPSNPEAAASPPTHTGDAPPSSLTPWQRQARQLGLFFAGAGFMAASVAVTRRSVLRRQLESFPRFYSSNRVMPRLDSGEGSLMAVQALGLATLNVASFGILLTGGIAWSFDLCDVRDLRVRTQAALRRPGTSSEEDEKEMEQMVGSILEKLGMQEWREQLEEEVAREGEKPGHEVQKK